MKKASEIWNQPSEAVKVALESKSVEEQVEEVVDRLQELTHLNTTDDVSHAVNIIGLALQERDRIATEKALRNVPVGFVRQWINEDLLKKGSPLVTNQEIQKFINIALPDNK